MDGLETEHGPGGAEDVNEWVGECGRGLRGWVRDVPQVILRAKCTLGDGAKTGRTWRLW